MSIYVFSTFLLSLIFVAVFGSWWQGHAPFLVHVSALLIALLMVLAVILLIAIFPLVKSRKNSPTDSKIINQSTWGKAVANSLSTPSAVLEGLSLIFINKAFLRELGLSADMNELIGMPFSNIVHPRDHQTLSKMFVGHMQDETDHCEAKIHILYRDGSFIPVSITISPLRGTDNSDFHLLQLTSQSAHIMSASLMNRDINYQLILKHVEQPIFHLNADQEIIYLSPYWESLLDFPADECLNQKFTTYFHPEDKLSVETQLSQVIMGKRTNQQLEARVITKHGELKVVEMRVRNTSSYKGERSSIVGTLTDISRAKQTESRLHANRRSLTTLLSNVPGMIYRCKNDRHWTFEFVSDGCKDVTGYEAHEIIDNHNFSYMLTIHEEDRANTFQFVQEQIALQKSFQMTYRIHTRSGSTKWVWEHGRGIFSSTGELLALEGFITEINNPNDSNSPHYFGTNAFQAFPNPVKQSTH